MALVIASVPVLTGEVAEKFESQAEKTYEEYLKRASEEKMKMSVMSKAFKWSGAYWQSQSLKGYEKGVFFDTNRALKRLNDT